MENIKKCEICGNVIQSRYKQQKYCCSECREAAYKNKNKAWHDAHPGYMTNYMKEYRNACKLERMRKNAI